MIKNSDEIMNGEEEEEEEEEYLLENLWSFIKLISNIVCEIPLYGIFFNWLDDDFYRLKW